MNHPLPRATEPPAPLSIGGQGISRNRLWFRLALKELFNHRRFSLFFIINLALGLAGFIALDSFQTSLDRHLTRNSKAILGADLAIIGQRPIEPDQRSALEARLPGPWESSNKITFVTMVSGPEQSRLVQLVAVEQGYPFYGKLVLGQQGRVGNEVVQQQLLEQGKLWVYPELLVMLGLNVGDTLRLGSQDYVIADTVLEDPSSAFNTFGVAPRVYMGVPQAQATGLLTQKSRVNYEILYRLEGNPPVAPLETDLERFARAQFEDVNRIRVRTHEDASENLGRVLGYLNDYLGLIALIALFLASIGAAYLFRSFLRERFREMAVLMSLGAQRRETVQVVLWQLMLLGTAAALGAVVVSLLMLPALPWLLAEFLPRGFESTINPRSLWLALAMGSLGSIVFCLPVLERLKTIRPLSLFHEHLDVGRGAARLRLGQLLSYAPLILTYWVLAMWQSQSWKVGSAFIGLLLICILLLGALAWGLLALLGRFGKTSAPIRRLAFRNLSRNKLGAVSCFLAISVGTLLVSLIPQIQQGIQSEVSRPSGFKVPSLFLFDIQPEQRDALNATLNRLQAPINQLSPLIRARLERVNGEPFRRDDEENGQMLTREEEQERRFRSRGMNVSYRPQLSSSEQIVAGRPMATEYDLLSEKPADISLEERFASRLGIEVGDVLQFDIQGVPMEGQVVNLRQVKWNSFQPNFFVLFQAGVLEEAPASFIGSIPGLEDAQRLQVQNVIAREFPNVSVIDVTRIVSRVLEISDQMSLAIKLMAYLSILAGLVVVFSIARYEVQRRVWEINLLKVLGARFQDIRGMVLLEFGLLSFLAATFGVVLSLAMSYALAWQFFESLWELAWQASVGSIVIVTALGMGVALLASASVLRQKPLALLKAV
jgi:putative ABC transport system permease protein